MTKEELLNKIDALINAGDEKAIEAFLLEHFKELPEDAQGTMLLSYVEKALAEQSGDAKIAELQDAAIEAIEAMREK